LCQIVTNNIFPCGNGKYIILLHFNGTTRQIVIDDLLPRSTTGQPLHVTSQTHPPLIYPALVEKALLKVFGGYDFPGSNSATDLHVLTGWIPEVVHLQEQEVDSEALWKRVFRAWREGDVLCTVGTGPLTTAEEREFGLVGEHNYSIFDIRSHGTTRLLQVRNPWSKRGIPKRTFRPAEGEDFEEEGVVGDDVEKGTFWLEYHALRQSFRTLYLNWNPRLFGFVAQRHLSFVPGRGGSDVGGMGQIVLQMEGEGVVWVLVERHYLGVEEGWEGYIGLALFQGNERIYSYTRPINRVPLQNSPSFKLPVANLWVDGVRRL
jgi:calpain-7